MIGLRFTLILPPSTRSLRFRRLSTAPKANKFPLGIELQGRKFPTDEWTNVTPKIISLLGRNLHRTPYHPLCHLRQRIVDYFYKFYRNKIGNPIFTMFDDLNPVVSVRQNFESLLIPKDHPSRNKNDCYYVNHEMLLRAHTTAHQAELISMGLNNFLVIGDVYRRDEIDSTHYPVFHQVDAVRLCTVEEVFRSVQDSEGLKLFEHRGTESEQKQACHSLEAVKMMEHDLKHVLVGLAEAVFGRELEYRWVDEQFPFTHPSWELEVLYNGKWLEILGCGIMRQEILQQCGAGDRIGWAFGLGLERLAMCLYEIPDIRLFWSQDPGFLNQFKVEDPSTPLKYKPVSIYPPCTNDLSFWLPEGEEYSPRDFYDIVREVGGDVVEQIHLVDEFTHPKTKRTSHCYRIVYRHLERTLTQQEANDFHQRIIYAAKDRLKIDVR